jgi:hypothetical protein
MTKQLSKETYIVVGFLKKQMLSYCNLREEKMDEKNQFEGT